MIRSWTMKTMCGVLTFLCIAANHPLLDATAAVEDDFDRLRQRMVASQIRARGIDDARVLDAMESVPRHLFVPPVHRDMAYRDTPLPIGNGQTISQPYIVALMSQLLSVGPGMRVLEIGTGSGYQAAVLAAMGVTVFSIEIVPELGRRAQAVLQPLGYDNIHLKIGDGYQGWPEYAPFDGIIVTCAPERIPAPLEEQLAEGGRMVIPVGQRYDQQLLLLTKTKGAIHREKIIDVRFVPMVDETGKMY
jgi:protein-L-isoaspartate(D-aspartate) O-methyltransferase